ncbi:MAG: hypothetical protein COA43_01840 [Robiginitomaculum sp.]|nr:MAG: hypothetical protein COA43_01840 [Robiginitomaculum sp.]
MRNEFVSDEKRDEMRLKFFTYIILLVSMIAFVFSQQAHAQVLWLKADEGLNCSTDNCTITSWDNKGSVSQPDFIAGDTPTLDTNPTEYNFNPSIYFDGTDHFASNGAGFADFTNGLSAYVIATPTTSQYWARFFGFGNGPRSDNIFMARGSTSNNLVYSSHGSGTAAPNIFFLSQITNNKSHMFSVIQGAGADNATAYSKGLSLGNQNTRTINIVSRSNNYIGRSNWDAAYYNGRISEVIIYDTANSAAEQKSIQSYLALKYGMTLDSTVGNYERNGTNLYTIDATYKYAIAGIGEDTDLHQRISKSMESSGALTVATTNDFTSTNVGGSRTSLANGQYLVWGHDNGSESTTTTTDINTLIYTNRATREWKIQNTNSVGNVFMKFDNLPPIATNQFYRLLYSANGDFTGVPTVLGTSSFGTFSNVSIPNGTGYLAVAIYTPPPFATTTHDQMCKGLSLTSSTSATALFTNSIMGMTVNASGQWTTLKANPGAIGFKITMSQSYELDFSERLTSLQTYVSGVSDTEKYYHGFSNNGGGSFQNMSGNFTVDGDFGGGNPNSYISASGTNDSNYRIRNGGYSSGSNQAVAAYTANVDFNHTKVHRAGSTGPYSKYLSLCAYDHSDGPESYGVAQHIYTFGTSAVETYLGSTNDYTSANKARTVAANTDGSDDGVAMPTLKQAVTTTIPVIVNGAGYLQAWIDWNGDGDFNDIVDGISERIATDVLPPAGGGAQTINLSVAVPPNATLSSTIARFRYSTQAGLGGSNIADNGEVEDYALTITEFTRDLSDAPASYGIPSHIIDSAIYLGASAPDVEVAAQPSTNADGDDTDGNDDEDGVVFPNFTQGITSYLNVDVSGSGGYLQAWLDWNGDGNFTTSGDQIATDLQDNGALDLDPTAGKIRLAVRAPSNATISQTYARLRWSTTAGLGSDGIATDGEVEDYALTVIAKTTPTATCPAVFEKVATSGTATQSTNYSGSAYFAPNAIDGNTNGAGYTHTGVLLHQWWNLDLGESKAIDTISIWNRTNCCGDRLDGFHLFVSQTPFPNTGDAADDLDSILNNTTVFKYQDLGAASVQTTLPVVTNGRYIRVVLPRKIALSIAELQVNVCGSATLNAVKSVEIYDPNSEGLYALPGNDITHILTVTNTGAGLADNDSISLIDKISPEVEFYNGDFDGAGPETHPVVFSDSSSALTFTYATDVGYWNGASAPANFAACTYTPSAGYDPNVTYVCYNPKGAMARGDPDPSFIVKYRARIK